ncbi:hypothetical protein quinque_007890 [Culex quinquefasciatus]
MIREIIRWLPWGSPTVREIISRCTEKPPNRIQILVEATAQTWSAQLRADCQGLRTTKAKTVKKLFYQKLSISINELENKKQKKKELILYPNKNGTVASLLAEAAKVIEFHETKLLRISELSKNRLAPGPAKDTPLKILVRQELERLE